MSKAILTDLVLPSSVPLLRPGCDEPVELRCVGDAGRLALDNHVEAALPVVGARGQRNARIAGEVEGFVKIVFDKKYDEILGIHMIGPRSTELVAEATLAIRLECTVEELLRTIHAHPTMSEAVGEAAHAAHGGAIHA